jgi:uncharacterized protein
MRKIDIHHHLIEEKDYVENLLRTMDSLEIEKTALIGLGPLFKGLFVKGEHDGSNADDDAVERVVKQYPDRFFGLGYIRLGVDTEEKVRELYDRGFSGLKFHIPKERYDCEKYYPVYDNAQHYGLPCLFHTGIINFPKPKPEERISSFNMDVIHLEAVAQIFSDLKIIIAHLGVQNYLTALTLIRIFPNIYADLSGSTPGWRANLSTDDWKKYLWFDHAFEKIMFGSDVHFSELQQNVEIYKQICDAVDWNEEQRHSLFHENALNVFSMNS